jgi:UDP-GlcNAc:undecaprenyl-phosphate/decaprenyl-phosphate GlcNAc-1-phosphate transferase
MRALPLLLSVLAALVLAPVFLAALREGGHTRMNYRDRELPFPLGVLVPSAVVLTLVPVLLIERLGSADVLYPELLPVVLYAIGVIALGLIDDTIGRESASEAPDRPRKRGWRGHGAAVLRGELSTGALKAAGSLGLALLATSYLDLSNGRWLLASGVLVLATNVFNLLDLRPGRAGKAFVILGAGLTIGAGELRPLWTLGLFAGPALVAGF